MSPVAQKAFMCGRADKISLLLSRIASLSDDLILHQGNHIVDFCNNDVDQPPSGVIDGNLPTTYVRQPNEDQLKSSSFNFEKYFENLTTKSLGTVVVHAPSMNSTFDILEGRHILQHGLVVVADQQSGGQGRAGNIWMSPIGCATFSFQLVLSNPRRASLLQHLTTLAAVHAIRTLDGYQNLNFRLKWPNDLYFGDVKLGGVLVKSSFYRNQLTCNVGMGVNLDNELPTSCINQIISEHNNNEGQQNQIKILDKLSREFFMAQSFNFLESFLDQIETSETEVDSILELYHKYWLHGGQVVKLQLEGGRSDDTTNGKVVSIDRDGFLQVELDDSHQVVTVHPDGNSFNMMEGLILPKVARH